jgi:hypothetical protein
MVLIGCFSHGIWVTERFGELLNIPSDVVRRMRDLLERRHSYRLRWHDLDIAKMAGADPAEILFVHDSSDKEIPYEHVAEMRKHRGDRMLLHTTHGLGHRRILRDPTVIAKTVEFLTAAP